MPPFTGVSFLQVYQYQDPLTLESFKNDIVPKLIEEIVQYKTMKVIFRIMNLFIIL